MAITDTVADLLTRIRNACLAKHRYVDVRFSKLNKNILQVLIDNGYIDYIRINEDLYYIRVFIKYIKSTRSSVLNGLKRVSKPSLRKYVGYNNIPSVFSGLGVSVVSTSSGIKSGNQAKKMKLGGEILCLVW